MSSAGRAARGRAYLPVLVVLLVVLAVALVGLSPFALAGFTQSPQDWEQLSLVGQTYGAASALLAGLALLGIAATLALQLREVRNAREVALRESNNELLRMAMDNPEYWECWGPERAEEQTKADRQHMYTNMIFNQWEIAYEAGAIGDAMLRAAARETLSGRVGRRYWRKVRDKRLATSETRRARRFHHIIDEEFHALPEPEPASESGPGAPGPAEPDQARPSEPRPVRWLLLGGAAGAAVAGATAWAWTVLRRSS
jgi:hypothetical protein